jgi:phosphopantetheinyl transferase (holo-ACP synthase)
MENNAPGPIATLDSSLLAERNYEEFLSHRERQECLRFRTPLRKSEWLAGRLCSKFLFLSEHVWNKSGGTLSASDLVRFPSCMYRSTEVRRNDHVRFGLPQVGRGDEFRDVAISHTNGIACALLGNGETIAVDMERVETRAPVFYRGNFTERERAWAEECSRRLDLDPHWSFTVLWSIKECLLKTPAYNHLSLWDMPSLGLRIVSGENDLVHLHSAREFSGSFVFLNVEATGRNGTTLQHVAVSGRYDLVITAIGGVDRRTV